MSTKKYGKLIRDRIPEIIEANGQKPVVRMLEEAEYKLALIKKLQEEVDEFTKDQVLEELADITEVVHALVDVLNESKENLEDLQQQKATKNGAFKKRLWLEAVEE